ncbi:chitin deacetylase [Actinomortierella ambigua]|uniref:Chitin deacetylase n=1 Tax=Actinomortierella ambigua TaxID=1343610 RepID=A0A9P6QBQ8_9FUNG|nr:chitin deacetylase [Actinomortierella ambigua]KAG0262800.1 chitin deacetylase [Actinomortierella ambigua]
MVRTFTATLLAVAISLCSTALAAPVPTPNSEVRETLANINKRSAATIVRACTQPNTFAVTFDDGPSPATADLLDFLKQKGIKVTFFVNGLNSYLITDPEIAPIVQRAHAEGHQIASHTWAHADLSAPGVDIASQMTMLDDTLQQLINVRPVYMRPPYGNTNSAALQWLGDHGYIVVNWNVDTNDWRHPTDYAASMQAYDTALRQVGAKSKTFISLQHDAEEGTARVLGKLAINYILSKGFSVVPVGTCLGDTTGWYRQ